MSNEDLRSEGTGCSSAFFRPWVCGWINQWSPWRMASAMPDLRLPSQPQGITAARPVPSYTAWRQMHMCVNNLPKVVSWKREAGSRTSDLRSRKSSALTTPRHQTTHVQTMSQSPRSSRMWFLKQRTLVSLGRIASIAHEICATHSSRSQYGTKVRRKL